LKLHITAAINTKTYTCRQVFFAKSKRCPQEWYFDHVGFVSIYNQLVQISTHRIHDGVYVLKHVSDDPEFPAQDPELLDLPKAINVPGDPGGAENCGDFVAKALVANGIRYSTQDINKILKLGVEAVRSPLKVPA
jgi:hypothetical protein